MMTNTGDELRSYREANAQVSRPRKLEAIVARLLTRGRNALLRNQIETLKAYATYDEALADSDSYEDPGVVAVVSWKTALLRNSLKVRQERNINQRQTLENLFVLTYTYQGIPLDVMELGGACGAVCFELDQLLPNRIGVWCIVETPAMCTACKELFQDERVLFAQSTDEAALTLKKRDLLMAQGVLQYLRDPLQAWENLFQLGFEYVYLTRMQVLDDYLGEPIITKQIVNLSMHGPGAMPSEIRDRQTSQPLTLVTTQHLTSRIPPDHEILFSFNGDAETRLRLGSTTINTKTFGMLIRKNS
jgi:putative methyltransferase (TIGR04325 family)